MSDTQSIYTLRARTGGYATRARHDPRDYTRAGTDAFLARFQREVDPDHQLDPEERERRATAALRLHMARLSLRSVQARRRKAQAERELAQVDTELADLEDRLDDDQEAVT